MYIDLMLEGRFLPFVNSYDRPSYFAGTLTSEKQC